MNTTIDVHTHFIPQSYLDALEEVGISAKEVGFPLAPWSTAERLALQDKHEIQVEMLSLSSPGLRFFPAEKRPGLCRRFNEELAQLVSDHPNRFGGLHTLPLPDVRASLEELTFAYEQLNADGVILMTNYGGSYPGDPQFTPVLEELNRRKAVVLLHPTEAAANAELVLGFPAPMVEYPAETTRCVVSLLDQGIIRRFPDIRWIASHGGGTLPMVLKRIETLFAWKQYPNRKATAEELLQDVAAIYWDLAIVSYPAPLAAIRVAHPVDRVLMGFDLPFYPADQILPAKENLSNFEGFTDEQKRAIDFETAHALFPRLATG